MSTDPEIRISGWKLTTAYGSNTAVQKAGGGFSYLPVFACLSGLMPGTDYHYRLVAISSAGTDFGPDMTFKTLDPPAAPSLIFSSGPMVLPH